jgi:tRNA nucleotidyltransferase/poly(A) polymerase
VVLDPDWGHYRVVYRGQILDFTPLNTRLETELKRRDFTINAVYATAAGAAYGLALARYDLEQRIQRAPQERNLTDDRLRAWRAVRLAVALGFQLESRTAGWIIESTKLPRPAPERIQLELIRILRWPRAAHGMRLAARLGLLVDLPGAGADRFYGLAELIRIYPQAGLSARLALLFASAAEAEATLTQLRLPARLVREAVQTLAGFTSDRPELVVETAQAQFMEYWAAARARGIGWATELSRSEALALQDKALTPPLLSGNEVMDELAIPAGPILGELLRALRRAQALGEVGTHEEALRFVKSCYEAQVAGAGSSPGAGRDRDP